MSKITVTSLDTKILVVPGRYEKDGQTWILTKYGKLEKIDSSELSNQIQENKGRRRSESSFKFKSEYDRKTGKFKNQVLTYDTKLVKDHDSIEWWKNHPWAVVDGNVTSHFSKFNVVDLSKTVDTMSIRYRERLKVTNLISKMAEDKNGHKSLSNIMYFFGAKPEGKSVEEMVLDLTIQEIDPKTGEMMGILMKEENLKEFNRTFVDGANIGKDIKIAISKAKSYKVIVQRNVHGQGLAWYWQENLLGVDDMSIFDFFQKHTPMFKALEANLATRDANTVDAGDGIPDEAKGAVSLSRTKMLDAIRKAMNEKNPIVKGVKNPNLLSKEQAKEIYDQLVSAPEKVAAETVENSEEVTES